MTDDELKAIEERERLEEDPDCAALIVEVRRLLEVERRHDALYAHFADVHVALGKHDDKTLTAAGSVRALVAEVRRLRGLIGDTACRDLCPWCVAELWIQLRTDNSSRTINGSHHADCPAFTPDGAVR